jgi:hypothetical protein
VAALSRLGAAQIPTPDLVTQEGDIVYLTVAAGHVAELDEHLTGDPGVGSHS